MNEYQQQYKLRPLKDILDESSKDWREVGGEWRNVKRSWVINRYMASIFGDGRYYTFKPKSEHGLFGSRGIYTHTYSGYYWHESWFERELIMEFNDEDFLL
jgi:hypothetical protein